jgi:hypothetical protein
MTYRAGAMSEGQEFTIRQIRWATLWMATCLVAWVAPIRQLNFGQTQFASHAAMTTVYVLQSFQILGATAAIGVLFGRTVLGLAVGVGLYISWIVAAIVLFGFQSEFFLTFGQPVPPTHPVTCTFSHRTGYNRVLAVGTAKTAACVAPRTAYFAGITQAEGGRAAAATRFASD